MLCSSILNDRLGPIYPPKTTRMEKTDATETQLINIRAGWAKRGGGWQGYRCPGPAFLLPLKRPCKAPYQEDWGCRKRPEQLPQERALHWWEYQVGRSSPLLSSHHTNIERNFWFQEQERPEVLACTGGPHYRVAGVLLTPASVVGVFKRNAGIAFCALRNGKHRNKENFQCLSPKLQGEFLCFLVELLLCSFW